MIDPPKTNIKAIERPTHTLHALFKSGEARTYNVYADNIATMPKYWNNGRHINGIVYLLSNNLTWSFKHTKGIACIKTDTLAQINVEVGKVDSTKNPLSREENYDNPLN